jgi:hypothetical protein
VSDRIFDLVMSALQKRVSRRRMLARTATAGSALAVAPLRYLLRPLSPLDTIRCSDCSGSATCCDGWTSFCCTINSNKKNECPSYTFMGGWWKCTNYTGTQMCSKENVRYYIDCNRTPTASCPEGCHCANNACGSRSTCCNVFRYGQCNTEVTGVTEVVCRMITCVNPCTIFVNCNCTSFVDNATCSHESPCL